MKIINVENKKPVVYVQQKNLKGIINSEEGYKIPKSLIKIMSKLNLSNLDETHDEEFVRIEGKETAAYIASLPWIPDYRELRDLSEEEISALIATEKTSLEALTQHYNSLSHDEKMQNWAMLYERKRINQKIKDLNAFLWTRQGKYDQPIVLPIAIDSEALQLDANDIGCSVGLSFDKKHYVFAKNNGKPFTKYDNISLPRMYMALTTLGIQSGLIEDTESEDDVTWYTEAAGKYIVAKCKSTPLRKETLPEEHQPVRVKDGRQKRKTLFEHLNLRLKK